MPIETNCKSHLYNYLLTLPIYECPRLRSSTSINFSWHCVTLKQKFVYPCAEIPNTSYVAFEATYKLLQHETCVTTH
jgi:hypothetical protein